MKKALRRLSAFLMCAVIIIGCPVCASAEEDENAIYAADSALNTAAGAMPVEVKAKAAVLGPGHAARSHSTRQDIPTNSFSLPP